MASGSRASSRRKPSTAALALLLLSPQIPLLFMGEDYGERRPFQFFTDFAGDLAETVRKGRSEEFHRFKAFTEADARHVIPDPNALATFAASRLDPDAADNPEGKSRAALIKALLAARAAHIVPVLPMIGGNAGTVEAQNGPAFIVSWRLGRSGALIIAANLSADEARLPAQTRGTLVFAHGDAAADALADGTLPPWSVVCRLDRGREG